MKLDKVEFPKYDKCAPEYKPNLEESHSREDRAIKFYAQAGLEAEDLRVKEIFGALVEVEQDHLRLSETRLN